MNEEVLGGVTVLEMVLLEDLKTNKASEPGRVKGRPSVSVQSAFRDRHLQRHLQLSVSLRTDNNGQTHRS